MIIFSQRGLTDYTATSCEGCPLMMHFDVSVPSSGNVVKIEATAVLGMSTPTLMRQKIFHAGPKF